MIVKQIRYLSHISVISLRAVSAPMEKSVPGTLLEMVAGRTTIGIRNSLYFSLASCSCRTAWKASKPPITTRPWILYLASCSAHLA